MKIKYVGPAKDYSGYGEANRHDIGALNKAGIQLTTKIPQYTPDISDYGALGDLAVSLENKLIGYNMIILHTTPNVYKMYMEPGKYHIGRAFWETDKVPLDFAVNLQLMDEIWTGSEFNRQAMINSGITKPIYIIPEAIDDSLDIEKVEKYVVEDKETFKFYSIFEWTERKNPGALLEAYWREFAGDQSVSLTIKTYVDNFSRDKKTEIDDAVRRIKRKLNLPSYAPVYLYKELMDRYQIYRFHKTFDCFVSAHRGEGWGIPQMEALLMEKPIISTNCGGIHEYLKDGFNSFLLDYKLVPIGENTRNKQWYTPDQKWAEVDIDMLRKKMRFVYENRDEATRVGKNGRAVCIEKFGLKAVGTKMRERLTEIEDKVLYPSEGVL